jgi:hypothetical protein
MDALSEGDDYVHFSSLITGITLGGGNIDMDEAGLFTDGMMVTVARQAFEDMEHFLADANEDPDLWPGALTVLQAGGNMYLSSSIKNLRNGFMFRFRANQASVALQRCGSTASDLPAINRFKNDGTVHRTGGCCGEVGAVYHFYTHRADWDVPGRQLPAGARVVTVTRNRGVLVVVPPCGVNPVTAEWGCTRFIHDQGIRAIDANTQPEVVPDVWRPIPDVICL